MAEMSSVSATLHTLAESSPPSLPRFCSVRFTQTPAPGNQGGTMEVIHLRYSWATLHNIDSVSRSVLSRVESRFLSRVPEQPLSDTTGTAGGPTSPGSSHTGGSRPPAAPAGLRGSGATPPFSRRKNKRAASGDTLPVASNRSIRSLRSQRLNERLANAHDAAMAALMEEDARATVVQPHYAVYEVEPTLVWPNGGVVVYAQLPFLLDESWRSPGLCLLYCRKVLCDPDPRNMGGTYETIFNMNKGDIERERQAVAGGGRAQQYPPVPGTLQRPPGSPTPTTPTSQPTPSTPSSITDGAAATPAASTGPAASAATGSVPPEQPTGDRAVNEYEGLQEEELELGLLPDLSLGATPTSVFMGMLGTSTPSAGTAGAPRDGAPTVDTTAGVPPRVAPPPGPPTAGAPLVPVRPDGSEGNPSSVADRDAPVTSPMTAGRDSAAVAAAAVSAIAPGQPLPDSPSRPTAQQLPTPGRPPRQRESTRVTADAFEAELA